MGRRAPARSGSHRAAPRAGALALLAALALSPAAPAPPAAAQASRGDPAPQAPATREMAAQKARMLESFLVSDRVRQARAADPEGAGPLGAEADRRLLAGKAALEAGRPAEAGAEFDAGLHLLSQLMALARPGPGADGAAAGRDFDRRRAQARSYLEALDRAEGLSAQEADTLARLRARLEAAEADHSAGRAGAAAEAIAAIYSEAVTLVSAVQQGRTAFVSRVFDTAEDAYDHERARNADHRLLVRLALAEHAEFQPGLDALAASLTADSDRLRREAETLAEGGDLPGAIAAMERSTGRLLAVLRAAGLVLSE